MTRFIFVTGGVVSSLGKGIAAASLAALLEARGLKVSLIKLDPYINVDPGTMSPFQHGEVFVTADGAETDLDLGHYERFVRMRKHLGWYCSGFPHAAAMRAQLVRTHSTQDVENLITQYHTHNQQTQVTGLPTAIAAS